MASDGSQAAHERVIVIGGGLAGIAAAVRLADHGVPVTLVETSRRLGGRATSFTDPATGQTLDNCQHVLLPSCTNLLDLYRRLEVEHHIHWHRTLHFADAHGNVDELVGDDLPAPLHLLRSLVGFRTLSGAQKLAVIRGMLAVMQVSRADRDRFGRETFSQWLSRHRQSREVIDRFWSVIITSACNERPARVAASYALQVLQEGLLYDNRAYEMGVPAVPLAALYEPARQRIEGAGGEIILGAGAERFLHDADSGRVTYVRLSDRQELGGSAFISAVPPERLARLVDVHTDDRLGALDMLPTSPIVGIHLFLRRDDGGVVMDRPHLALLDGEVQWVFNKGVGEAAGDAGAVDAQHLHGVVSAAHELVHQPAEQIVAMALDELGRALPAVAGATLVHSRVIKEKRATFSAQPGLEALRPPCAPPMEGGGLRNLYLAGDWVRTGWPATMEGAVRSGYRAAAEALNRRGQAPAPSPLPAADLEPGFLYRFLSA